MPWVIGSYSAFRFGIAWECGNFLVIQVIVISILGFKSGLFLTWHFHCHSLKLIDRDDHSRFSYYNFQSWWWCGLRVVMRGSVAKNCASEATWRRRGKHLRWPKNTLSEFLKLCQKRCKEVILRYKGAVLCTCVLNAEIKSRLRDVRRSPLSSS